MKEWECIQVGHNKNMGNTIGELQKDGWRLHTYQAAGFGTALKHYLLF